MTRLFIPVVHGAALDRPDERDTIEAAAAVAGSLRRLGYESEIVALGLDLSVLARLAERWPHVVFNLVEALDGNGGLAHLPLAVMDHLGLAYTGATRAAYALSCSKLATKQRILRHGVPTPGYWPRGDGVPSAARVIVKSVEEHASIGMDADSVVSGKTAAAEVRRREARFGGQFFAEDYIEGREFNVSLIEMDDDVRVLPIQETLFTDFPAGRVAIVDYDAKWNPDSEVYNKTPRRFGVEASRAGPRRHARPTGGRLLEGARPDRVRPRRFPGERCGRGIGARCQRQPLPRRGRRFHRRHRAGGACVRQGDPDGRRRRGACRQKGGVNLLRIRKIRDTRTPGAAQVVADVQAIMRAQFPGMAPKDIDKLPDQLEDPLKYGFTTEILVAEDARGVVRGFAILLYMPDLDFAYLETISAAPGRTGGGLGAALYDAIREESQGLGAKGFFFECLPDDPALSPDPKIRRQNERRLAFYERYGARPIVGTAYEQPIEEGTTDSPYLVFDGLGKSSCRPRRRSLRSFGPFSNANTAISVRRAMSTW